MFIDLDNRGSGKTTTLIMDAYFTGVPILVSNVYRKEYLLKQAEQMHISVTVYTVEDLRTSRGVETLRKSGIMIDELEDVLFEIIGVKVVKATMSRRGAI